MKAKSDFEKSINEITILNDKAKQDMTNDKIYYKSIVLLLCAKLEKYVKDSTKEYISEIIDLKLSRDAIPQSFIAEIIDNEIAIIQKANTRNYISKDVYKERAKIFSIIWDSKYILSIFDEKEFVISISSNGTNKFDDVYKKIGLPTLISNLKDYIENDIFSQTSYSIKDNINKVINMRHQIIHDDATPSITQSEITLYEKIFRDFVFQIDVAITNQIETLKIIDRKL